LHTIAPYVQAIIPTIKIWCVEELKTARRFLKAVDRNINIDELTFFIINEHTQSDLSEIKKYFTQDVAIGLLSEAGCPAVADPGSELVSLAHNMQVKVIPYVGPSSILMALMASGFNGQRFQFVGYIPVKEPERSKAIRQLEAESQSKQCTQIFIETPYRNAQSLDALLSNCNKQTRLCIAANISAEDELIVTKTIGEWKNKKPEINKKPAVFLLAGW
jgi:16S rRNA (cytidine1402-2'-O)-methyltransferase